MVADATRHRLLDAARAHLVEVGAESFSLREVARRAGVTAPAVYRHFADKDALLHALCEEGFRLFLAYLVRSLGEADALARLQRTGREYLRFALERPQDYRVIFLNRPLVAPMGPKELEPSFRFLVDRVRECMAAGVLADGDAEGVSVSIWAHVHGLVALRLCGHLDRLDEAGFAALFDQSVAVLLRGLAGRT